MRTGVCVSLLTLATLVAFGATARGQGSFGGLTGHISDPSGAAIPEVAVKVTDMDSGVVTTVLSTADGSYAVSTLPAGRYRVVVTKPGFKTVTQEPVEISTATVSTLNFTLPLGQVTESVQVTAELVQLQTTTAEIGTVLPEKDMLDLPISLGGVATAGATGRRQIENFIFLTPGVTGNQWSKSINGAPGFSQEILIDGIDVQTFGAPGFIAELTPPYEAVNEFKVQNALYPAEYGLGYGVMNFTLKSGTNKLHGDAFEFVRNDKFDARGFFASDKPPIRQNEFGFTVGGPVMFPRYNGKDKTHFFFAYTGFRLRGGLPTGGLVTIPTMQERNGDFSDYPFPIFDPTTTRPDGAGGFVRDAFTNNFIRPGKIGPIAKRAWDLLPPPDIPGTYHDNYVDRSNQPSNDTDWSVKIDHQIGNKHRLAGAFWKVNSDITINGPVAGAWNPGFRHTPTHAWGLRVNHSYNITPNLLNHVGFGLTPTQPTWTLWEVDKRHGNEILKIPGIPLDASGFPDLSFDQPGLYIGNAQENGFDPQKYTNWQVVDDLNWVKGRHQLKVGMMWRYRTNTARDVDNTAGVFTLSQLSTSQPNDPNFSIWGNAFASFALGQVLSAYRQIPGPLQHFRDTFWAGYAEDAIKVTPKLTVNLGLRYELPVYVTERDGILSRLDLTKPNPGAAGRPGALIFLGDGPGRAGTRNIFGTYHKSIAPRASLAYSVNDKTVVRLGYGLFRLYPNFGRMNSGIFWNSGFFLLQSIASTNQGITPAMTLDGGFPLPPFSLPNFDPAQNNGGAATYVNSSANRPARMQSWTVDLQRELPFNVMLDAAYVGSNTNGLWTGLEDINQVEPKYLSLGNLLNADFDCNNPAAGIPCPYTGFTGSVAQALRAFPQYTTIWDMFQPTGYNTYQSLQVRLQKRYSNGLSFLSAYTLSKNIGVAGSDTFGDIFGGGGDHALDSYNRRIEKALAPIDRAHVLVLSWSYELPFGRGKKLGSNWNPFVSHILGGWQANSIERYQSGTPIGIRGGPSLPLFGGGNRPNWLNSNVRSSVPMDQFDPAKDLYLNISAFGQPAPFTLGNAPRYLPDVRTPASYNEDFSVFKSVSFGESRSVEFRAEMFDVFNRVVFGPPARNVNNPSTFGIISSQANDPRVIQFGLKLLF